MKNLLLVYPSKGEVGHTLSPDVPLALLYLSGAARVVCDTIKIFDFNAPFCIGKSENDFYEAADQMYSSVSYKEPLVVGINCIFSANLGIIRKLSRDLKLRYRNIKIVIGGMHPTLFHHEIMRNCPEIDAIAIGEADESFPLLLRYFFGEANEDSLDGVCLRINGQVRVFPKKCYVKDLNALPRPGYEFINFEDYRCATDGWYSPDGFVIKGVPMPILTSRSCPNKCVFCAMRLVMGDAIRFRSAENVFEEIKYLHETYGINYFKICDDNFSINKSRIEKICNLIINSGMKLYFNAHTGLFIRSLTRDIVQLMRQAGVIMTGLGVESGSPYLREVVIGKKISNEEIVEAFEWCNKFGINVSMFLILGLPEETEDTLLETIKLIENVPCQRVSAGVVRPFPGTRLFEQCVRDDLFATNIDLDKLWDGKWASSETLLLDKYKEVHLLPKFYIKPYALSLEKLEAYQKKIDELINKKTAAWRQQVLRTSLQKLDMDSGSIA